MRDRQDLVANEEGNWQAFVEVDIVEEYGGGGARRAGGMSLDMAGAVCAGSVEGVPEFVRGDVDGNVSDASVGILGCCQWR